MFRIGYDIGGTNIVCGLIDENFGIVKKVRRPFDKHDGGTGVGSAEAIAGDLYEMALEVCRECGVDYASVPSVGVCIPGSVDTGRGVVIDAYNLGLHDCPFREVLSKRMDKPCELLNDADAAALAENRIGALRSTRNSMLVTIGTGIGVGLIIDGRLYHGGRGFGCEAGHAQMDVHGESCTCGRRGCIETLCSASRLTRLAGRLYAASDEEARARFDSYAEGKAFDAKALIEGAKRGDGACLDIWNAYLDDLANALASYVNILDPELIAIGGGVSGAGDFLIEPLIERTAKQSFFREPTRIVCAELGNDAGLVGAGMYEQQR